MRVFVYLSSPHHPHPVLLPKGEGTLRTEGEETLGTEGEGTLRTEGEETLGTEGEGILHTALSLFLPSPSGRGLG